MRAVRVRGRRRPDRGAGGRCGRCGGRGVRALRGAGAAGGRHAAARARAAPLRRLAVAGTRHPAPSDTGRAARYLPASRAPPRGDRSNRRDATLRISSCDALSAHKVSGYVGAVRSKCETLETFCFYDCVGNRLCELDERFVITSARVRNETIEHDVRYPRTKINLVDDSRSEQKYYFVFVD